MDNIEIEFDATEYAASLSHLIAQTIGHIELQEPIAVASLFDTPAFSPSNPTAREQLARREPLVLTNPGTWASTASMVPLNLQYRLFQDGNPIRLDIVVKDDLVMHIEVDTSYKKVTAKLQSKLSLFIRDPIIVQGRVLPINETLILQKIVVTDNSITYQFNQISEPDSFVTIHAIYNPQFAHQKLGNKAFKISINGDQNISNLIARVFAESINEGPCNKKKGKKHVLWAKNGICSLTSGDICINENPRDKAAEKIGCYDSEDEAWAAGKNDERCRFLNEYADPFILAQRIKQIQIQRKL